MAFVNSIIVHSIFEKIIIWFVEINVGISTNHMIFLEFLAMKPEDS